MMYGTEGQRAAVESDRAATLRDILGGSWYVVNLDTGETVPATGGLVAVDFESLNEDDRDTFERGCSSDVAWLAARVGWTLDVMGEGDRRLPVPCPVGITAGARHTFEPGTGVVVEWSVMGDPRTSVEVCADCAKGVEE